MNAIETDLRELGQYLWPDGTVLRPRVDKDDRRIGRRRSLLLSLAIGAGTAVVLAAVLAGSSWLSRTRTAISATPPPAIAETAAIDSMHMLSASDGWGWGATLVARTTDGAATFADVTPLGLDPKAAIVSVIAVDMQHAWVLVAIQTDPSTELVYRTVDRGATWTALRINAGAYNLTFIDPEHGWVEVTPTKVDPLANHIGLWRTSDGGDSWSLVYQTTDRLSFSGTPSQIGDCQFSEPTFVTPLLGVDALSDCPGGIPYMDMSTDGGATWRRIAVPQSDSPGGRLVFSETDIPVFTSPEVGSVFAAVCVIANPNAGGCSTYGALEHTNNGGATWTSTGVVRGDPPLASPGETWVVIGCIGFCPSWTGTPYLLLHTADGGLTWASTPLPVRLTVPIFHGSDRFQFVNARVGFDLTESVSSESVQRAYYRTHDGGVTWTTFTPRITPAAT
jgi:photosystem II stability/assembly factor-like uncharacterized protein